MKACCLFAYEKNQLSLIASYSAKSLYGKMSSILTGECHLTCMYVVCSLSDFSLPMDGDSASTHTPAMVTVPLVGVDGVCVDGEPTVTCCVSFSQHYSK